MIGEHLERVTAVRYVADQLDAADAGTVESHVEACPRCARLVSQACTNPALRRVRAQVLESTGPRSRPPLLLSVTPAFRPGWLLAVVGVVVITLGLDLLDATRLPLVLLVAPLLPLSGIAASCATPFDRTAELTASTPTSPLRLLLLRSAGVLASSVPLLLLTSALTGTQPLPWLLPAGALVALSLALSVWVRVELGTALAAGLWAAVALAPGVLTEQTPVAVTGSAAPAWAALLTVALAVLLVHRTALHPPGALR